MLVVSLPRHDDAMLEVDHATRRLEMSVNAHEVVHNQREACHLLTKRHHHLVKLHFMEHLLIE